MIHPEFMKMVTRHEVEFALQTFDGERRLQCDAGHLDHLLMETVLLGERINVKGIAFIDERRIFQSDTATNVDKYMTHFILLSH